jgi:hypothetical protein
MHEQWVSVVPLPEQSLISISSGATAANVLNGSMIQSIVFSSSVLAFEKPQRSYAITSSGR